VRGTKIKGKIAKKEEKAEEVRARNKRKFGPHDVEQRAPNLAF
jgi:hypothetical protein